MAGCWCLCRPSSNVGDTICHDMSDQVRAFSGKLFRASATPPLLNVVRSHRFNQRELCFDCLLQARNVSCNARVWFKK